MVEPGLGRSLQLVEDVFDLMDQIDSLANEAEIRTEIVRVTSIAGFDRFAVARLPQPRLKISPYLLLESYPKGWANFYDSRGHFRHDPVVSQCFGSVRPFLWSEIDAKHITDRGRLVMNDAMAFGLTEGFAVPIHDVFGFQAVVSMGGPAADASPDMLKAFHLLAIAAFAAAERLAGRPRGGRSGTASLSPREREVLLWIAAGLSKAAVGVKLRIGVTTVETHVRSARHKLEALNTVHAVVEAIRRREINP